MIGIIAAVSSNGVIGINDKIPWNYPEDMRHFKQMTENSVVIMGRKTFESIGRPLPKRDNIVITRSNLENSQVQTYRSVSQAVYMENKKLSENPKNIWFIGGASIYEEGLLYADKIYLTLVPDYIDDKNAIKFPWINPSIFKLSEILSPIETTLKVAIYEKIIN
ncbi:FolA Dihydrofolate reductase [uncultured Caudovirales phage]|uniref:dihydrofolate reductase n=1 Tax=uncultured Caudovirales phage TaxID=2100421 RepID=A0A6J5RSK8_9CAUD|nr:FolA Dihydrofolate reductase [uncultured Caudovirales phage]